MQYTSADFERVVRRGGLQPIARKHLGHQMYLYTAEGEARPNGEMPEPHWVMVWAVGLDDKLQFGQYVRVPTHVTLPHTQITTTSTRADRVAIAERQAMELIRTADTVGMFDER